MSLDQTFQHMVIGKIDITPFFWTFLEKVCKYDHNSLMETDEYKKISECVFNEMIFVLRLETVVFETDDVNELFQDVEMYYRTYDIYSDKHLLIKDALVRIYQYIEIENSIEHLFDHFSF